MNYKGKWVLVKVREISTNKILAELKGKIDYISTGQGRRIGITNFSIVDKNKNRINLDYGAFCSHEIVRQLTDEEIKEVKN